MQLKRPMETKSERIDLRVSKEIKNKIRQKAALYTNGKLSEYILYAALNFVASIEDFEETKSPAKKRGKSKK